ncbi:MAG: hypothetical protein RIS47_105, partial [Bacteroidota bacterium]
MKHYLFISIFAIYFCAVGCITVSYTPTFKDAQAQYNPARTDIHPEFLVQIKNDSTANVMVRILSSELLFTRANIENKAKAQIGINCAVYSDVEKRVLFDTLSVFQEFVQTKMPYTSSVIRLRIKPNSKQLALVVIQDITRRSEWSGYIEINSRPDFGAQRLSSTWAKISNTPESNTEQLNFYNWVPSESIVRIYAQSGVKMRSFLSYYALPLEVSPPPFAPYSPAVDPLKPDTTLFLTTGDFAPTEKG